MTLNVRRVVTGHDHNGKAVVLIDDTAANRRNPRPGVETVLAWMTDSTPADRPSFLRRQEPRLV